MVFRAYTSPLLCLTALFLTSSLIGCGGGGNGANDTPLPAPSSEAAPQLVVPRLVINWGKRTRAAVALTSALSATVQLQSAAADGSDITFVANRDNTPEAHAQTYTAPTAARIAPVNVVVTFYSEAAGQGSIVGRAEATVQLQTDGAIPAIAIGEVITSVEVVPSQTAYTGEKSDLAVTCKDAQGNLVATSPGAVSSTVIAGNALRAEGSQIVGVVPGQAQVVAQVDGIDSAPQTIGVTSRIAVAVSPPSPRVGVGRTIALTAALSSVPAGATSDVMWRIVEADGGTIAPNGVFTAPAVPGVYTVIATSVFDPEKQVAVSVTVEAGNASVGAEFPPSGNLEVGVD